MGFSLTVLALLARLRVLVQQILLDIVPLFNTVSSLSQKKQSTKITHQGIEVFREFFPKKDDYVTIEYVWNTDKFELVERTNKCDIEMQEGDNDGEVSVRGNAVKYKILESFLGDDDEPTAEKADAEISPDMKDSMTDLVTDRDDEDMKQVEDFTEKVDATVIAENIGLKNVAQACSFTDTGTSTSSDSSKLMSNAKKVAFVSVKMPAPSTANPLKAVTSTMNSFVSVKMPAPSTEDPTALPPKETRSNGGDKADAFYSLLTRGNLNDSLFG